MVAVRIKQRWKESFMTLLDVEGVRVSGIEWVPKVIQLDLAWCREKFMDNLTKVSSV